MDLPNLKELKAILKLCRSQGVTKLTLAELVVEFGDLPMEAKDGVMVAVEEEVPGLPTDEELAYYSALPDPLEERQKAEQ